MEDIYISSDSLESSRSTIVNVSSPPNVQSPPSKFNSLFNGNVKRCSQCLTSIVHFLIICSVCNKLSCCKCIHDAVVSTFCQKLTKSAEHLIIHVYCLMFVILIKPIHPLASTLTTRLTILSSMVYWRKRNSFWICWQMKMWTMQTWCLFWPLNLWNVLANWKTFLSIYYSKIMFAPPCWWTTWVKSMEKICHN